MNNDSLKSLRKIKKLTQSECASYLGIPLRTYQNYENDVSKASSMKYQYMIEKLKQYGFIDETHGILTVQEIKDICSKILPEYDTTYCYLFGYYAKGKATETSDVDLLINTKTTEIKFFDLIENIREHLHKKVDLLSFTQLKDNLDLTNEILMDGIKIFG